MPTEAFLLPLTSNCEKLATNCEGSWLWTATDSSDPITGVDAEMLIQANPARMKTAIDRSKPG